MGQLCRLIGFDPGQVEVIFSASKLCFLSVLSAGSSLGDDAGVKSKAASQQAEPWGDLRSHFWRLFVN